MTMNRNIWKKFFIKETIAESAIIVMVFQFLLRGLGIIRGIVFARALGPFEYGIYSLALVLVNMLIPIVTLGVPSSFSRYIPYYESKGALEFFIKRTYLFMAVLSIIWMFLFIFLSRDIARFVFHSDDYQEIVILSGFHIPLMVFTIALESTFIGLRIFKISSFIRAVEISLGALFGIIAVCIIAKSSFSALLSQIIASFVVVGVFVFLLTKYLRLQRKSGNFSEYSEDKFLRKLFRFSIWFLFISVMQYLFKYTDRWMLNFLLGEKGLEAVGVYTVGSRIAGILFMTGAAASRVLTPNLSAMWEASKQDEVFDTLNISIKICSLSLFYLAVPIVIFKEVIISWLFGLSYIKSIEIIPYLCVFAILNVLGWVLGSFSLVIEKPQINFVYSLIGVLMNIFLNYNLIKIWGMKGAAVSTMLSYWISLMCLTIWLKKQGLTLPAMTIVTASLPFLLLLNTVGIIAGIVLVMLLLHTTGLILDKNEKQRIKTKVLVFIRRF